MPGRNEVEAWLANTRSEIDRVGAAIEPLMTEQARLREREALLVKLLRTMDDGVVALSSTASVTAAVSEATRMIEGSVLDYVRKGVMEVLREHSGGPMHINDIFSKFVAKGFRVPGAGRPANLTAHLARCQGIVSPSRGFYALAEKVTPAERKNEESARATIDAEAEIAQAPRRESKARHRERR